MTELDSIVGCNFDLIISHKDQHPDIAKETFALAKTIQSKGVNVILTPYSWPRDSLFFPDSNSFIYVNPTKKDQVKDAPHLGWYGGAYLLGDDFMIADSHGIGIKRQETLNALKVSKGFYIDTQKFYDDFKHIVVSGNDRFHHPESFHIDPYFNIGNLKKILFTYDVSSLIEEGIRVAKEVKYDLVPLPLEDAKYAAIGFIELGDHIVIDCRAKKSMKIIENLGYTIIPTNEPLIRINQLDGSLRCSTKEAPLIKHKMKFHSFQYGYNKEGPAYGSFFGNLEGNMMIMDDSKTRKLREPLFSFKYYG
ncbi:MAG: hypothetical protein WC758_00740 [Candidatus Woesearchaeota archaeon]|jgi:hypothetical protein